MFTWQSLTSFLSLGFAVCSQAEPLQRILADGFKSTLVANDVISIENPRIESRTNVTELLSLHKSLVSIPSVSGDEHEVAIFLRDYLESLDLSVELQPVAPQDPLDKARFNVFAYPPGHRDTPLLLTSHIDTVPPYIPYSVERGDEIWGTWFLNQPAFKI